MNLKIYILQVDIIFLRVHAFLFSVGFVYFFYLFLYYLVEGRNFDLKSCVTSVPFNELNMFGRWNDG